MTQLIVLIACILLGLVALLAAGLYQRYAMKKRGVRTPEEFKLLRGPGESLRKKIHEMDENVIFEYLGSILILPISVLIFQATHLAIPSIPWTAIFVGLVALVLACCLMFFRWLKFIRRYQNYNLGYKGERAVAEHLTALYADGYRIYHDMPAENKGEKFNLDHVVIGPSGVWLIETKTRRKGRARPGFKDHEVIYDGRQLIYPWAEETYGLEQAKREAQWLAQFIQKRTGLNVPVLPVLALPGWFVTLKARGEVRVLNPKSLASVIRSCREQSLDAQQVDQIARQVDLVCRVDE